MKRSLSWLLVALFLVSCGGGDDGAGPGDGGNNNTDPTPTTPGTPIGTATTQPIGAAGGTVTSADGLFSITIPPGALPAGPASASGAETDITIQPITNTAWGGVGTGYRLLPDGLTFSAPVELSFSLEDSLLAGSDTLFVDGARQDDEGVWGVLKHRRIDWEARKLICTTSHFSDYTVIEAIRLRPGSATVPTLGTVNLRVRYCRREVYTGGDDDLAALIYTCTDNGAGVPAGTFTNWSVNGAVGGNALVGGVAQTGVNSARYTAPHDPPQPNPVLVRVTATGIQGTRPLVSRITIADTWSGVVTIKQGTAQSQAFVIWTREASYQGIETYRPSGYVDYTPETDYGPVCDFVSMNPRHATIEPANGLLVLNFQNAPFAAGYGMFVNATTTTCFTCDGWDAPDCSTGPFPSWFAADSLAITDNGTSIAFDGTDYGQLPPVHLTVLFSKGPTGP